MIAFTKNEKKGERDALLTQLANRLTGAGVHLAGIVQINTDRKYDHRCDMDVRVLPDGPLLRISQSLGKEARGCRLDTNALETAVMEVERTLQGNVDLLILNKFGKMEAEGRGFRDIIAKAVMLNIPVICGVNSHNIEAFEEFAADAATQVESTMDAMLDWCTHVDVLSLAPS